MADATAAVVLVTYTEMERALAVLTAVTDRLERELRRAITSLVAVTDTLVCRAQGPTPAPVGACACSTCDLARGLRVDIAGLEMMLTPKEGL